MANANQLGGIEHIVVLMLENRSFDHMLGYLYADANNHSPAGHPYEGLTGTESNPGSDSKPVKVFRITATTPNAYLMPGADPGEGYAATNHQLFGSFTAPASPLPASRCNQGFVQDFAYTLGWESRKPNWKIVPGTSESDIMGCFSPEMLPVLSGLARGYAVCDHWFSSVPTETMPNRAFAGAATSQGHLDDKTKSFTVHPIFWSLSQARQPLGWSIYGYDADPLTRLDFPDTAAANDSHFGRMTDFTAAASSGQLGAYTFLEPSWGATGNSQHPNYDVAKGEELIHNVYSALSQGPGWKNTAPHRDLRRTRGLLRPRCPTRRGGHARRERRRGALPLHALRGACPNPVGLAAHRAGHGVSRP
jgi:phospholipase C